MIPTQKSDPLAYLAFVPNEQASADTEAHIIPNNDIREHHLKEECWCMPTLDPSYDDILWMHNALDDRDQYKYQGRKPH